MGCIAEADDLTHFDLFFRPLSLATTPHVIRMREMTDFGSTSDDDHHWEENDWSNGLEKNII